MNNENWRDSSVSPPCRSYAVWLLDLSKTFCFPPLTTLAFKTFKRQNSRLWLSHCCSDRRSGGSPAGFSQTEVGFTLQTSSAEALVSMGTHLSPEWSAGQSVGGEPPKKAKDKMNYTNDDSKFELWQDYWKKREKSPESEIRNRSVAYMLLCWKHNLPPKEWAVGVVEYESGIKQAGGVVLVLTVGAAATEPRQTTFLGTGL